MGGMTEESKNTFKMDSKLLSLKIPPLPKELATRLQSVSKEYIPDTDAKQWIEDFHSNQILAVASTTITDIHDNIQEEINSIYSPYFNQPVHALLGKLVNIQGSGSAQSPPHCDRYRQTAINYILELGGENVSTCFYKEKRKDMDFSKAENALYTDIELDFKKHLATDTWYSFNVQEYHSVENITGTRLFLGLLLKDNIKFEDFKIRYSHLLV